MVTVAELEARRELIAGSPDLATLLERLVARAEPVLTRMPPVPQVKALLSADGGVCPACGAPLLYDPWSPERHSCSQCGVVSSGERHHAHWARMQHLWLAERAAHLATIGVVAEDQRATERARELLQPYFDLYFALPNRDNVLGPSHLFFSTYLESMWVLNYFAAAHLLRDAGLLEDEEIGRIDAIAEEATALIGEFNEGMSNRQTWNSAALTALAVWFGDEALAQDAIQGRTGLLGHLTDGFGSDGMWFEGENYHLFALRGLLIGLHWARVAGIDLIESDAAAGHLGAALLAPAWSALPDFTFPARKDSRFGVSLAQPAYLESWEAGLAWLLDRAPDGLTGWLRALYQTPVVPAATYDAYLHEAGEPPRKHHARSDLSWWALFHLAPELPDDEPWRATSRFLPSQGLGVIRQGDRYLSLECGGYSGGHGHADRLHLTLHADGVHWLADPGAGSYVSRDLYWYRSTLAHNAPRLDGGLETPGETRCAAFDEKGAWAWVVGTHGPLRRTMVSGPAWIADLVELNAREPHTLELPWHLPAGVEVETPGSWAPGDLEEEFVGEVEQFAPREDVPLVLRATAGEGKQLRLFLDGGTLLRARCPGLPYTGRPAVMYLVRARGATARLAAVLDLSGKVTRFAAAADVLTVTTAEGLTTVRLGDDVLSIRTAGVELTLGGARSVPREVKPLLRERPLPTTGQAIRVEEPPALDGSLDGFDTRGPVELAGEHHYLRSEEPYPDDSSFSAVAYMNWDDDHLYLAVEVTKPELIVRPPDAPPLRLDNEADDIHSDGIQVYYQLGDGEVRGHLVRPWGKGLLVRWLGAGEPGDVEGGSQRIEDGYRLTVALPCPGLGQHQQRVRFDLLVNEMRPGRLRRAGQLVWSGGDGWVYLRGDRHDPARFGELELLG